jgi:hypothetical protein
MRQLFPPAVLGIYAGREVPVSDRLYFSVFPIDSNARALALIRVTADPEAAVLIEQWERLLGWRALPRSVGLSQAHGRPVLVGYPGPGRPVLVTSWQARHLLVGLGGAEEDL